MNVVDAWGSFSTEMESANVTVGEDAALSCKSDSPVNWRRQLFSSGTESERICYGGKIVTGFENEYAMDITEDTDTTPVYKLIIHNANHDVAGEYTCIENSGLGPASVSANLTVHGKYGVTGAFLFAINPELEAPGFCPASDPQLLFRPGSCISTPTIQ